MFVIDKDIVPEYIVEQIKEELKDENIYDEDEYYDKKHKIIDDWVSGSTGEAKELVDDFGVLNAIRLYKESYGEFILDEDDNKVYLCLAFCIIYEWFNEHYSYEELKTFV